MLTHIKSLVRRFRRQEEGSMVVEAVIMFPTLFAAVIATFVFFDAFRNQSVSLKAAYTISDAISREEIDIDNRFIVNSWRMHRFLTNSASLTRLRISIVQYNEDDDEYSVAWSRQKGGAGILNNARLNTMVANDEIPVMPHRESILIVQTWVDYEPNFNIGFEAFSFEDTVFTRIRAAPNGLCYKHDETSNRLCPIGV